MFLLRVPGFPTQIFLKLERRNYVKLCYFLLLDRGKIHMLKDYNQTLKYYFTVDTKDKVDKEERVILCI